MKNLWRLLLGKRSQDLEDEIAAHLAMAKQDREERGETADQADRTARREFGNRTLIQEVTRSMWAGRAMEGLWQDIRYGGWTMWRSPVFTAVAVLSLALGIGANTAIFTLIDTIMLQWLPVREPARLVLFYDGVSNGVYSGNSFPSDIFSYPAWRSLQAPGSSFEGLCAFRQSTDRVALHVDGGNERAQAHLVSGNYFEVLGVQPALGRVLRPSDTDAVAVISYQFWQERFGRDSGVVGRTVVLNKTVFTVVGVAAREFFGERIQNAPDFWVPLLFQGQIMQRESFLDARNVHWLNFMGRLKPGVSSAQAEADVTRRLLNFYREEAGASLTDSTRRKLGEVHVVLKPGGNGISGLRYRYSEPLHLLMAVVTLVLAIACANIATLLLARSSARRREFMARVALGATPGRIVRQVLTESVLLSTMGGLAGTVMAWWSLKGLILLLEISPVVQVRLNPLVLGFTMAVTILTGILFGFIPAVRFSRMECKPVQGGAADERGKSVFGGARVLMVMQVALSFVLLLGAALLTRSLITLQFRDTGFSRTNILLVHVDPQLAGYDDKTLFPLYRKLQERLSQIPGVVSASLARYTPVSGSSSSGSFSFGTGYALSTGPDMSIHRVEVGPRFFETLGIPVLLGRVIGTRDTPDSRPVAVVNSSFAATYFPNKSPLGQRFSFGFPFSEPGFDIVGVVGDSQYYDLREKPEPMAFLSAWQMKGDSVFAGYLLIRTAGPASAVSPDARRVIHDIDSKLPVISVSTLAGQVDDSLRQQKLMADLCSAFGAVALLLSAIGIYGTIAYSVARRTVEIGIRMALGAPRGRVVWLMAREAAAVTLAGLAAGLPIAFFCAHWIQSFLFGVQVADPAAIGIVILLVSMVAVGAGYLPAARATRRDPARALKYE